MEETKVRIGEEVLLDIGTDSEWYISSLGYDGESVDITLRRKADRDKDWWRLVDTPQSVENNGDIIVRSNLELFRVADTPQTEKPKIRKRIDKPFRAVWLDDDHNEIGTPQSERSE